MLYYHYHRELLSRLDKYLEVEEIIYWFSGKKLDIRVILGKKIARKLT